MSSYIVIAGVDRNDDTEFPAIALTAEDHEQYEYGLFALFLVIAGILAFISYRNWIRYRVFGGASVEEKSKLSQIIGVATPPAVFIAFTIGAL